MLQCRLYVQVIIAALLLVGRPIYSFQLRPTTSSCRVSAISCSSISEPQPTEHQCKFCNDYFASRNALFRHLRTTTTTTDCFQKASLEAHHKQSKPKKIAIRFGYLARHGLTGQRSISESAADLVQRSFYSAILGNDTITTRPTMTQTSAANLRHPSLKQENGCCSASDYIGIRFEDTSLRATSLASMINENDDVRQQLLRDIQSKLDETSSATNEVAVLDIQTLPLSSRFHAEQSCTQRVYHYLLPLDWLLLEETERDDMNEWCRTQRLSQKQHQNHSSKPKVLQRLKQALQSLESANLSNDRSYKETTTSDTTSSQSSLASPGRFGALWAKERRCWHNFAATGTINPGNDCVWRAVDKAKVAEIIPLEETNSFAAVIEIRGDGFVTQQVSRMVGAVVAIVNEWLPRNFIQTAVRPDLTLETPLAPPGRLYFAGGRFHFLEATKDISIVADNERTKEWKRKLQRSMMQQASRGASTEAEHAWLQNLQNVDVPRIRVQLNTILDEDTARQQEQQNLRRKIKPDIPDDSSVASGISIESEEPPPPLFQETLSLLRAIVANQKWPPTSKARSRVIKSHSSSSVDSISSSYDGQRFQSGSFIVLNRHLVKDRKVPIGNELFPKLSSAVFDLEVELSKSVKTTRGSDGICRPPSSHCAINRNVEFAPHVDSGQGVGQSVSMIVGLGDYSGGSVVIEGNFHDVRYNPLEYNGWEKRHWTTPFEGERFSLVWFTPAIDEDNLKENRALEAVQEHQKGLPSFPVFKYRPQSTDTLVINEIFGSKCCYELYWDVWKDGRTFSLKRHECVLDIGAHIGAFSRFALSSGCQKVISYEPEESNLELLYDNLQPKVDGPMTKKAVVEIHESAVAHGEPGYKQLVHARSRNDGTINTWRHALEEYSQYVDRSNEQLQSSKQEGLLTRTSVFSVPFFGGALEPGVTFVKLDCEGAEIDILCSEEAAKAESWLAMTHLVFEWSFTKEKRIVIFHKAVANLQKAGFQVVYEGQGAWWDRADVNVMWPFHNDLVVYAKRLVPP